MLVKRLTTAPRALLDPDAAEWAAAPEEALALAGTPAEGQVSRYVRSAWQDRAIGAGGRCLEARPRPRAEVGRGRRRRRSPARSKDLDRCGGLGRRRWRKGGPKGLLPELARTERRNLAR